MNYDSLGEKELKTLYFYAYCGGSASRSLIDSFCKLFSISRMGVEQLTKKLYKKGLVENMFYSSYRIATAERLNVLRHLLMHHREYLKLLEGISSPWEKLDRSLLHCLDAAIKGNTLSTRTLLQHSDYEYFMGLDFSEEWMLKMLFYLPDASLMTLLERKYDLACINDAPMPSALFQRCINVVTTLSIKKNITDLYAYHSYIFDGVFTAPDKIGVKRPWQHMLLAVRSVHEGDYTGAVGHFDNVKKAFGNRVPLDSVGDLFGDYYEAVAQVHLSDKDALRVKDLRPRYAYMLPAWVVKTAATSADNKPTKDVMDVLEKNNHPIMTHFRELFSRYYFGRNIALHAAKPRAKAMQFEMQKYLTFTGKEFADLQLMYGDKPGLTSIKMMKKWEWDIREMLGKLDRQEAAEATAQTKQAAAQRIVYYVDGYRDRVVPQVQKWLKSGRWGAGSNVGLQRFCAGEYEMGDPINRKFASLIRFGNYYDNSLPTLAKVAHLFVGLPEPRLFSSPSLENPVEIVEEQPYVQFDKQGDKILIQSNLTLAALDNPCDDGSCLVKGSTYKYKLIPLTDVKRSIIGKMLAVKEFPIEAEQMLTLFLARLEGVMEVRSALLSTDAIPLVDASTVLVAQLTRVNVGNYSVALRAKPVPEGKVYALPGAGKRQILSQDAEGKPVRVKRNFEAETQALEQITEAFDSFEGVEYDLNEADMTMMLPIEGVLSLMTYAKEHPEVVSLEWPVGQALRVKQASRSSSWNVGLKSNGGWFDLEGDVRIDDATVLSMATLLDLVGQSKGQYVRMGENEYIQIDRKLRRQLERLEALAVRNRNKLQISGFNAALLDDAALRGEFEISYDKTLLELQQRIKSSEDLTPAVPTTLQARLRPYQEEGFQWMARLASWGAGACLADDMGLGKTVQTIAFLLYKASEGPALVVAPASVVPNWQREIERFGPSLDVTILNKAESRSAAIKKAKKGAVIICTYGLLNTEVEALSKKKWATVCLDEAHTIKNKETKMSQAAMKLQAQYRIILTGTPIQNHLGELWNLFRFINPGLLGTDESFRLKFVKPITEENDKGRRKALQSIIKPFMLRRTKAEVIDDLPDKTEIYMPVELADDELAMYEALRQRAAEAIEGQEKVDVNTLAEITRLRQAACSMRLVDTAWAGNDSKIQAFMDLVRDFKGDGNNGMLVFSQFTSYLSLVREALDKAGEPYLYLDGSTPIKQREQLVQDFAQGKCPIFLISLKAGGLGLNLPFANYVVHLDPWWNPAIEQQATDRAYRIGQKRNVTVYHLLAKNTIEEKIRRLHRAKRNLADSLLEGTDMAGKLSMADVLALLTPGD